MLRLASLLAGSAIVIACMGGNADASSMQWKISCMEKGSLVFLDSLPHDSTAMDREAVISRFPNALCVSALQEVPVDDAAARTAATLPPIAVPEDAPELKEIADSDLRAALAVLSGGQPAAQEMALAELPALGNLDAVAAGDDRHDLDKFWTPTYAYAHWDRGDAPEQKVHLLADVIPEAIVTAVPAEVPEEPAPVLARLSPPSSEVLALTPPAGFLRRKEPEGVLMSVPVSEDVHTAAVSLFPTLQAVGEIHVARASEDGGKSALSRIRKAWRNVLLGDEPDQYANTAR